jgi:hypothetical protein
MRFCNFACLQVCKFTKKLNLENCKLIITTLQIASAQLQLHNFESLQIYKI